jgi:hypothetical protein
LKFSGPAAQQFISGIAPLKVRSYIEIQRPSRSTGHISGTAAQGLGLLKFSGPAAQQFTSGTAAQGLVLLKFSGPAAQQFTSGTAAQGSVLLKFSGPAAQQFIRRVLAVAVLAARDVESWPGLSNPGSPWKPP